MHEYLIWFPTNNKLYPLIGYTCVYTKYLETDENTSENCPKQYYKKYTIMLDVYLILEEKLEFLSFCLCFLLPHWTDKEKLSSLYINFFIAYCYEC